MQFLRTYLISSVAKEGGGAIDPTLAWRVCKIPRFSSFEADFWTKNKNSPPIGIGDENWLKT